MPPDTRARKCLPTPEHPGSGATAAVDQDPGEPTRYSLERTEVTSMGVSRALRDLPVRCRKPGPELKGVGRCCGGLLQYGTPTE